MVMAPPPTVVPNAALLPPAMGPPTAPGVMVPTLAMVPTTTPPGYFWPPPAQFQSPAIITKPKRTVEELELELDCERQKVARLESELVKERAKKLEMQKQLAVTTLHGITWQYEMNGSWHAFPQEEQRTNASGLLGISSWATEPQSQNHFCWSMPSYGLQSYGTGESEYRKGS